MHAYLERQLHQRWSVLSPGKLRRRRVQLCGTKYVCKGDSDRPHWMKTKSFKPKKHEKKPKKQKKHVVVPAPTVSWNLTRSSVTAGQAITFTYATTHVPTGGRVQIQRWSSAGHMWSNVRNLAAGHYSTTAPGISLGKWTYRVVVLNKSGTLARAGVAKALYSYGTVPLSSMLNSPAVGSANIGGTAFDYATQPDIDAPGYSPSATQLWQANTNTCRSITLTEASGPDQGADASNVVDTFTVGRSPGIYQTMSVAPDTLGQQNVALVPGQSWWLIVSGTYRMYLNGSASCYQVQKLTDSVSSADTTTGGDTPPADPQPVGHACTRTSTGSCIQGGEFCKQAQYGQTGYDASGRAWTCTGNSTHPHWE